MSMTDPIADMLTRIRNAQMRGKSKVVTPASKIRGNVLDVLESEGFIRGYAAIEHGSGKKEFEIELKYFEGDSVIREIKRISKPGRRVYSGVKDLPLVQNGLGIAIRHGIGQPHTGRRAAAITTGKETAELPHTCQATKIDGVIDATECGSIDGSRTRRRNVRAHNRYIQR